MSFLWRVFCSCPEKKCITLFPLPFNFQMILKDLDRPRPVASHPLPLSLPGAGASVLPLKPLVRGHSAPASAHQATQTPGRQVRGIRYFESEG